MKVLDVDEIVISGINDCMHYSELSMIDLLDENSIRKAFIYEDFHKRVLRGREDQFKYLYHSFLDGYTDALYNASILMDFSYLTTSNILIKAAYQYSRKAKFRNYWTFTDLEHMLTMYQESFENRGIHFYSADELSDSYYDEMLWLKQRMSFITKILNSKKNSKDLVIEMHRFDPIKIVEESDLIKLLFPDNFNSSPKMLPHRK